MAIYKTKFKRCPCGMVSGFYLEDYNTKEKFYCQDCRKETSLNKWQDSTEQQYSKQLNYGRE